MNHILFLSLITATSLSYASDKVPSLTCGMQVKNHAVTKTIKLEPITEFVPTQSLKFNLDGYETNIYLSSDLNPSDKFADVITIYVDKNDMEYSAMGNKQATLSVRNSKEKYSDLAAILAVNCLIETKN